MGSIKIYFKLSHKQYYQQYCEGNLLLWCKDTRTGEEVYLGVFKDNKIYENPNLFNEKRYKYEYSIWGRQGGFERLSRLVLAAYYDKKYKAEVKREEVPSYFVVGRR